MHWPIVILLIAALLAACERQRGAHPPVAAQQIEDLEDSTCLFPRTPSYDDPDSLAVDFVRREYAGQFLHTDAWFNSATTCPGHEPAPDAHQAVAGYRMRLMFRSDTTVQYAVHFAGMGMIYFGFRADTAAEQLWDPRISEFVDTLHVIRTSFGWRIKSPALWQYVNADSTLAPSRLPMPDSPRFRALRDSLRASGWRGGT